MPYPAFRPLLFRLPPEAAHGLTLRLLRLVGALPPLSAAVRRLLGVHRLPAVPVRAFGLTFPNPVGLAAGYDKDALAWRGLAALGFGHIEVGTVTPRPQPGNPKPRLFRLPEQRALLNRLGFPSRGAAFVARQLQGPRPANLILGVNLGKNKATPNDRAVEDYLTLVRTFAPLADYLVVNVSSPNTEGLRRLQARNALERLLRPIVGALRDFGERTGPQGSRPPLLVKLAPDLDDEGLDAALEAILSAGADGVIATNTTVARRGLPPRWQREQGGLSGAPLRQRSTAMIRAIARRTEGRLPIIGVGGILRPEDALEKLEALNARMARFRPIRARAPAREMIDLGCRRRCRNECTATQKSAAR